MLLTAAREISLKCRSDHVTVCFPETQSKSLTWPRGPCKVWPPLRPHLVCAPQPSCLPSWAPEPLVLSFTHMLLPLLGQRVPPLPPPFPFLPHCPPHSWANSSTVLLITVSPPVPQGNPLSSPRRGTPSTQLLSLLFSPLLVTCKDWFNVYSSR